MTGTTPQERRQIQEKHGVESTAELPPVVIARIWWEQSSNEEKASTAELLNMTSEALDTYISVCDQLPVEGERMTNMGLPAKSLTFALSVSCPVTQDNPKECVLHRLRLLPLKERFERLQKLSNEEYELLVAHHRKCEKCRSGRS